MVVDAVRTYLDAANGLTELSRKQAVAAAKTLLRAGGPTAPAAEKPAAERNESLPPRVGQSIQALAGELIETSQSNRAAITDLVRSEVERQLESMDVVPRAEHERLVRRVAELERRLAARHAVERALVATDTGASSPVRTTAASLPTTSSADAPADGSERTGGPAPADGAAEAAGAGAGPEEPASAQDAAGVEDSAARGDRDTSADSGADDGAPAQEGGTGSDDGPAAAEKKTTAKSRPRAAAKSPSKAARTRATAKRPSKGRGGTAKK
ncbi:membrane fusogenic activity family protein [Nocardiopsis sp. TSRI0078]|uniref:membrane fusogenic activity family protein n=1 Tax=unclassified Nocardiopsis TaxID=2649073 RepID=UPI00093C5511|nr:membrane fusogenic activity family protein [Nocardiopsis sp. TSRI0078]OKI17656.1 membrane fusogenic activity family protein [Nocardiopsis sp. TSRI0078]